MTVGPFHSANKPHGRKVYEANPFRVDPAQGSRPYVLAIVRGMNTSNQPACVMRSSESLSCLSEGPVMSQSALQAPVRKGQSTEPSRTQHAPGRVVVGGCAL